MAEQVTNYQCPACTGPLHYDGSIGKLKCDYCESTYEVAEIEALYKEKEEAAAKAAEEEKKKQQSELRVGVGLSRENAESVAENEQTMADGEKAEHRRINRRKKCPTMATGTPPVWSRAGARTPRA